MFRVYFCERNLILISFRYIAISKPTSVVDEEVSIKLLNTQFDTRHASRQSWEPHQLQCPNNPRTLANNAYSPVPKTIILSVANDLGD